MQGLKHYHCARNQFIELLKQPLIANAVVNEQTARISLHLNKPLQMKYLALRNLGFIYEHLGLFVEAIDIFSKVGYCANY